MMMVMVVMVAVMVVESLVFRVKGKGGEGVTDINVMPGEEGRKKREPGGANGRRDD